MSKYTCFRCNRIFRRKDYLTKHLQRKFPCKDANLCETSIKNDFGYIFQNNQNNQKITKNNWLNLDIKNIVNSKKKFSKKDLQTILNYKDDIDKKILKKSNLLKKLELEHHIQISGSTLNKILRGEY